MNQLEGVKLKMNNYSKKSMSELYSKDENRKIIAEIKTCEDPELELDIWNLGLIYDIIHKNNELEIVMTFTSPMCPFGPQILQEVKTKLTAIGYIVNIKLVFNQDDYGTHYKETPFSTEPNGAIFFDSTNGVPIKKGIEKTITSAKIEIGI